MQMPPDEATYKDRLRNFEELGPEIEKETDAARKLIVAIIADPCTPSDNAALARIETRIEISVTDSDRRMDEAASRLLGLLNAQDFDGARHVMRTIDSLRDEFIQKIETIRADMLTQVFGSAGNVMRDQNQSILISAVVTALAAILG